MHMPTLVLNTALLGAQQVWCFEWEQKFLAVWQKGFSSAPVGWGALGPERDRVARRDLSSSECTTRRCACLVPYVFVAKWSSFWNAVSFEDGVLMRGEEELCLQWFRISIAKRKTWAGIWFLTATSAGVPTLGFGAWLSSEIPRVCFSWPTSDFLISQCWKSPLPLGFTCKWGGHVSNK